MPTVRPHSDDVAHWRATVAALSRHRPDSPELLEARRNLRAALARQYVHTLLAADNVPPLTQDQLKEISDLFATTR